ncbi:peritrophin-48 [Drosophila obscura]|uniref:peritrophin-48 n=1 Tax=Drosophila obscura TaxID=7282 RepID=UPI001BB1371D|nr:peritrophin-48 [Drosophila obscura]
MKQARGILPLLALACLAAGALAGNTIDEFEYLSVQEMCALLPWETSFLRPTTCDNWVTCPQVNGTSLEHGACATGLFYNKQLGRCNLASSVSCPYTGLEVASPVNMCANETDGTFLEDASSSDCRGYILCQGRAQIHANCPNELIFNPRSRSCVYHNQYTCPVSQTQHTSPACRSLANNTRLAHTEHCERYYECVNDILHSRECAAQKAYDVNRGYCVPVEEVACYATAALPEPENTFCLNSTGGYYADDQSCSHYYICGKPVMGKHDTQPQHLSCALGQYFDIEKLSCRDRLNVRCVLDRCVGNNMSYVNVADDCQKYARCSGGVTAGTGRCPDNYYFDERSQGCTPTNNHYIACSPRIA